MSNNSRFPSLTSSKYEQMIGDVSEVIIANVIEPKTHLSIFTDPPRVVDGLMRLKIAKEMEKKNGTYRRSDNQSR